MTPMIVGLLAGTLTGRKSRARRTGMNALPVVLRSPCGAGIHAPEHQSESPGVIVHEAVRTGGFGAEIAASMAEYGLTSLLAPVQRLTGFDVVVPLPRIEHALIPARDRILAAAREALAYA